MMQSLRAPFSAIFVVLALAGPGEAQEAAPIPAAPAAPAAYMKPLERLSTILGSVHYLRSLCGADDAESWRERMNALLDTQKPSDSERRILVAHFNGGYRAFESTYRRCTPSAELAVDRYLKEGAKLSTEIATRYGT
jgi:uncharacterized protein (TIGR02301 family)